MKFDVNDREFEVVELLGKGKGGYSYLVQDGANRYVLKQIHHEPCDYYQFGDKLASELQDYERLRSVGVPMPKLIDVDRAQERILKKYVEGDTIDALVRENRMRPEYIDQMRLLSTRLRAANLNIDYFPTNFVVRNNNLFYYVDYECNDYMDEWSFEHWGIQYWSRTPEFEEYEGLRNQ